MGKHVFWGNELGVWKYSPRPVINCQFESNAQRAVMCFVTEGETKFSFPRLWSQKNMSKQSSLSLATTVVFLWTSCPSSSTEITIIRTPYSYIKFTLEEHATCRSLTDLSESKACDNNLIKSCFPIFHPLVCAYSWDDQWFLWALFVLL